MCNTTCHCSKKNIAKLSSKSNWCLQYTMYTMYGHQLGNKSFPTNVFKQSKNVARNRGLTVRVTLISSKY